MPYNTKVRRAGMARNWPAGLVCFQSLRLEVNVSVVDDGIARLSPHLATVSERFDLRGLFVISGHCVYN